MDSGSITSEQRERFSLSAPFRKFTVTPGALLLSDLCLFYLSWAIFTIIPLQGMHSGDLLPRPSILAILICLCSWFAAQGHYTKRNSFSSEMLQVTAGMLLSAFVEWSMQFDGGLGSAHDIIPWIIALFMVPIGRLALKWTLFQLGPWCLPTAVVGSSAQCATISDLLAKDWYRGFVARTEIICDGGSATELRNEFERLTRNHSIRYVLIVMNDLCSDTVRAAVRLVVAKSGVSHGFVLPLSDTPIRKLAVDQFFGSELVILRDGSVASTLYCAVIKRCLDFAISLALLFLMLPVILFIAVLIRRDGGPIFYNSQRIGHGGKLFSALKFRTMAPDADRLLHDLLRRDPVARVQWETDFKLRHDPRITKIGRMLRELSLDELPQLINVLTGDMSLVGPRPLLPAERAAYGDAFEMYSQCIPGITGPWQVSGRNNLEYQERIRLNNWYARNASLRIDMAILFRTVSVVVRRIGAV